MAFELIIRSIYRTDNIPLRDGNREIILLNFLILVVAVLNTQNSLYAPANRRQNCFITQKNPVL